jgi:succinate dehydrogenase/fumarate reductase flavoprotein subunit
MISQKELIQLLKENKVEAQLEDISRLHQMMGREKGFEISRLLKEINKIDTDQFSNYTKEEALAFAKMFSSEISNQLLI